MRRRAALSLFASLLCSCSPTTSSKQPAGAACSGNDSVCSSGLCVSVDTETSICSSICNKTSDCTSGFVCGNVPTVGNVCLPDGFDGHCQNNDQCAAGFICDTTAGACYIDVQRTLCSPCTSDLQCSKINGVCRQDGNEQTCTQSCASMSCPTGFTCAAVPGVSAMQCVPDNSTQTCGLDLGLCGTCTSSADCGGKGSECVTNLATNEMFCATACSSMTPCTTGFACTDLSGVGNGPDVCTPNSGTCVGYCTGTTTATVQRECGIAANCDLTLNTCQRNTGATACPAGSPADCIVCSVCTTDDDCVKYVPNSSCLTNDNSNSPFNGQTFCSVQCTPNTGADGGSSSSCPQGFTCSQVGTEPMSPFFCLPDSGSCTAGGEALGDDCTALGADACLSGICIGLGVQSVCSANCQTTVDCGQSNFKCCALETGGTTFDCAQAPASSGGICAPQGGAFGADCSPGQPPCYGGVCLDLGTADLCSSKCVMDSDCPMNFSCRQGVQLNGDGTTTQLNICFPSGGGILGSDCTFGPAACQSGLCLQKETGSICTQSCGTSTTCPSGYRCLSETLANDAIQSQEVCVPG